MPGIFISYRRDDQPGFAGRLADALVSRFGADRVFRDRDDIHPGDDFVDVIEHQLQTVSVMLVMIGPDWLTASRNGFRRLDEPHDFVRLEIQAGLESGKPVLPVLLGGASMPAENDLPPTIAALSRRQAVTLTDANWAADIEQLGNILRPLLPIQQRLYQRLRPVWLMFALGLVAAGLLIAGLKGFRLGPLPTPTERISEEAAQILSGRWIAQVKYDWGETHEEAFDLHMEKTAGTVSDEVHGTASYLGVPRIVERGQLQEDRLSFITHSQEVQDDASREVTHRYRGTFKAGELRLILESSGGLSQHPPVDFVARRITE